MKYNKEPIAIIGMSSLFPEAQNLQQFWSNIFTGNDAITDVPKTHWNIEDYYDSDPTAEDKTYCRRGGFVPQTEFSPVEFGIPPNALDVIDVLQLLSLNVAKSALHDGGYLSAENYDNIKERTGVVLGITGANSLTQCFSNRLQSPKIRKVLASRGFDDEQITDITESLKKSYAPWEENSFPGMLGNVVAGRIANRFDMGGVNCTIDAACASSLAALRMAIDELQTGRADMMLTGGCDAENTILMYMCFSKTPAFSPRGVISPFDQDSDGTLIGEGIGMFALKRLSDAERDGDKIYSVIKGMGASSDGKFKSIYAPRMEGQIKCLQRAYEDAGFPINTVGLLEAHGTGTKVGDATEVKALKQVIGQTEQGNIALGSVKSQIGHTKAAAGSAGLIKMALALHHKTLPPTINIEKPTEALLDKNSPLYLNTSARPWLLNYGSDKRRAGVSAFGFGGTNFHVVMEEYLGQANSKIGRLHQVAQPVVIAADTIEQLSTRLSQLSDAQASDDWPFDQVANQALRIGFVAQNNQELQTKAKLALEQLSKQAQATTWSHPKGIYFSASKQQGKIAALFSGQGSQYVNMGKSATTAYPAFMDFMSKADKQMQAEHGECLSDKIYPNPAYDEQSIQLQTAQLQQTQYAQPAIGCVSAAAYATLTQAGFSADCVAGHSFGELSALWATGCLTDDDYIALAVARGQAMAPKDADVDNGTMAAVALSGQQVEQLIAQSKIADVYLCNFNTDKQTVIGGATDSVVKFGQFLKDQGFKFVQLPVSAAFHTPLVGHAQQTFACAVDKVTFNPAKVPLYRNKDGQPLSDNQALQQGLKNQLLEPVQFLDTINQMIADGVTTFVEFGPKGHLSKMVGNIAKTTATDVNVIAIDNGQPEHSAAGLNIALVQLAVAGYPINNLADEEPVYQDAPKKKGFNVNMVGMNYVSDKRRQAWLDSVENPADVWNKKPSANTLNSTSASALTVQTPNHIANEKQKDQITPSKALSQPEQIVVPKDIQTTTKPVAQAHQPAIEQEEILMHHNTNTAPSNTTTDKTLSSDDNYVTQYTSNDLTMLSELQRTNADLHKNYLDNVNSTTRQTVSLLDRLNTTEPQQMNQMLGLAGQGLQIVADAQQHCSISHQQYLQQSVGLAALATGNGASTLSDSSGMNTLQSNQNTAIIPVNNAVLATTEVQAPTVTKPVVTAPVVAPLTPEPVAIAQQAAPVAAPITKQNAEHKAEEKAEQAAPAPGISRDELLNRLMAIVAEKTGYPQDVLDPSMDIEADLGIDSIKRVEILGALQDSLPGSIQLKPEQATELKTLEDLATTLGDAIPQGDAVAHDAKAQATSTQASTAQANTTQANASQATQAQPEVTKAQIEQALLTIVSDKTGYPLDVLECTMDMESDLGIDSIKRVEILGEMHNTLPGAEHLKPDELASARTLQDIIDLASEQMGSTNQQAPAAANVETSAPAAPALQVSPQQVTELFLEIVAQKTGYPQDVLEMSMSLEADLGIDSIKRVEILGELHNRLELGEALDPAALSELNSLGDIADFIGKSVGQQQAPTAEATTQVSEQTANPQAQSTQNAEIKPLSPIHLHQVELQSIGAVEPLLDCYQPNAQVLLINEQLEQTLAIKQQLTDQGFNVHTLNFADNKTAIEGQHHQLPNWNEQSLLTVLEQLPEIDVVIYQHPQTNSVSQLTDINDNNEQVRALKHGLLLAKFYKNRLDVKSDNRKAFVTLARMDGQLGLSDNANDILGAGCFGLVKTLATETNHLFCRAIDVAPAIDESTLASHVCAEITDHNINLIDVGINENGRHTFSVSQEFLAQPQTALDEQTCFIVTGGARGITASCIIELAKKQPGKYLLLGRTAFDSNEPQWAAGIADQALKGASAAYLKETQGKATPKAINDLVNQVIGQREINATLTTLQQVGVEARYASVDITNAEAVAAWAGDEQWLQQSESLALIHGAGALADKLIESKQLAEVKRVFSVKLYGAANLLANIELKKLKFSCMFSSVAGLFGNIGQVDYAMANEILNRISVKLQQHMPSNGRAVSMIWGAWNAGMVTPQIKAMFESRGISLIEVEEGASHFVDTCLGQCNSPLQMVGPSTGLASRETDFTEYQQFSAQVALDTDLLRHNKLMDDHTIGGRAVLPATFAMGLVANVVENLFSGVVVTACQRMNVNKGIELGDLIPQNLMLKLSTNAVKDQHSMSLNASISDPETGLIHYSYENIQLSREAESLQQDSIDSSISQDCASEFYQDKTLFHGDGFQLLKTYRQSQQGEYIFTCQWHPSEAHCVVDEHSGKVFCPMYADALLQAALVWVKKSEGLPSLPMMIENLSCYQPIERGEQLYIRVGLADQSASQTSLYLTALTPDGRVRLAMKASVVKSSTLADKFVAQESC